MHIKKHMNAELDTLSQGTELSQLLRGGVTEHRGSPPSPRATQVASVAGSDGDAGAGAVAPDPGAVAPDPGTITPRPLVPDAPSPNDEELSQQPPPLPLPPSRSVLDDAGASKKEVPATKKEAAPARRKKLGTLTLNMQMEVPVERFKDPFLNAAFGNTISTTNILTRKRRQQQPQRTNLSKMGGDNLAATTLATCELCGSQFGRQEVVDIHKLNCTGPQHDSKPEEVPSPSHAGASVGMNPFLGDPTHSTSSVHSKTVDKHSGFGSFDDSLSGLAPSKLKRQKPGNAPAAPALTPAPTKPAPTKSSPIKPALPKSTLAPPAIQQLAIRQLEIQQQLTQTVAKVDSLSNAVNHLSSVAADLVQSNERQEQHEQII